MRRKNEIFILHENDSEEAVKRFQGFEGIIIYANGPRALIAKEGYYDNDGNYKLSEKLSVRMVSNTKPVMVWMREIREKEVFSGRIPEIAVTERAANLIGII